MKFESVSKLRDAKEYLKNIKEKSLVIYSVTSVEKNNIDLSNKYLDKINTKEITNEVEKIEEFINGKEYKNIIAIGGGTATDIGKYISYKMNNYLINIPTMLSTDAYATNKVTLYKDGIKRTMDSKIPDLILLDEEIIGNSKVENLFGLVDVLSIYTALTDWDIAMRENHEKTDSIKISARRLLNRTINYILNNSYEDIVNNSKEIFCLVGKAGEITNKYGCGKPESGSEHIYAKELEGMVRIPHALAVSNGILVMSIAQGKYNDDIYKCLRKLNIFNKYKEYGLKIKDVKLAFYNLKPREDRYSVVNKLYLDKDRMNKVYDEFERIVGEYYVDYKRFL